MGSWVWTLLGSGFAALVSLAQYALRLRFLWKVYDRGGRQDLAVAGKVTTSALQAVRRKRAGHKESSTGNEHVAVAPLAGEVAPLPGEVGA